MTKTKKSSIVDVLSHSLQLMCHFSCLITQGVPQEIGKIEDFERTKK